MQNNITAKPKPPQPVTIRNGAVVPNVRKSWVCNCPNCGRCHCPTCEHERQKAMIFNTGIMVGMVVAVLGMMLGMMFWRF